MKLIITIYNNKMKKIVKILVYIAVLFIHPVWAAEPFIIEDIRVEGLQRITPGTVFNYLPMKVGDTFEIGRAHV